MSAELEEEEELGLVELTADSVCEATEAEDTNEFGELVGEARVGTCI